MVISEAEFLQCAEVERLLIIEDELVPVILTEGLKSYASADRFYQYRGAILRQSAV